MSYYRRRKKKRRNTMIIISICFIIGAGILFTVKSENLKARGDSFADENVNSIYSYNSYMTQLDVPYELYNKPNKVKGIYVNASISNDENEFNKLINLVNTTELNSMVINVKNDSGRITFECDVDEVNEINADTSIINDVDNFIATLNKNNILPIARIVCFKDPYLARRKPEYAIKNKDGSLWEYNGIAWLNPYNKNNWKYIIEIAKMAIETGFKEIQFDYIRFESTSKLNNADLGPESVNKTRSEVILEFLDYANKELEPYGVPISADVFGIIITSPIDAKNLGQDYLEMVKRLDFICPMIYPSHYGKGFFNIPRDKHSDLYPYETVKGALDASNKKFDAFDNIEKKAIVRPWLQAFTADYLENGNWQYYGGEQIREQIDATYDAEWDEWLLWNAGGNYTSEGLLKQ